MKKGLALVLLLACLTPTHFNAQRRVRQMAELQAGNMFFRSISSPVHTRLGYFFNWRLLAIKWQFVYEPTSVFGPILGWFFGAGISTNPEKMISFFFVVGPSAQSGQHRINGTRYRTLNPYFEFGMKVRPRKEGRFCFGWVGSPLVYELSGAPGEPYYGMGPLLMLTMSYDLFKRDNPPVSPGK